MLLKRAHVIMFCFDLTSLHSLKEISNNYVGLVERTCPDNVKKILVGMKQDLDEKR